VTAFHEVQFPVEVSKGSAGGPERLTDIVTLRSGHEERNTIWAHSRRKYDAGLGLQTLDNLHDVIEFFEARSGRLFGFRWKDWADFKSGQPTRSVGASDQLIGTGDGSTTSFQLVKIYESGGVSYERDIKKPVNGTVRASLDGVETTAFAVDTTTGLVTLTTAPGLGVEVKAGFEFDVPARFDTDFLSVSVDAFEAGAIPAIEIIEVRV